MRHLALILLLASLFSESATTALAWNALGHRVISEIAWQQLTPERRHEIVDTLKRHPRFGEDFIQQMPRDVESADQATQDRWLFWQAAVWPDIARGLRGDESKQYDHPTWHYVNGPIYLDPSDKRAVGGQLKANLSADYPPASPEREWNIQQAVKHALAMLKENATPAPNRAIAYCWLFHLVGDSHQPLHSCALFSASRFPNGDRGGNDIPLRQGRNLHALWDNLLGRQQGVNDVKRRAAELHDREQFGQVWRTAAEKTDVQQWLSESYRLAKSVAYDDAIKTVVRRATRQQPIERIELSEEYLKAAGHHARERVLAAGLRLAEVIETIDSNSTTRNDSIQPTPSAFAPAVESVRPSAAIQHWLNTSSGVRHNSSCKWYGNTKRGRYCSSNKGKPCGECGG